MALQHQTKSKPDDDIAGNDQTLNMQSLSEAERSQLTRPTFETSLPKFWPPSCRLMSRALPWHDNLELHLTYETLPYGALP